MMYLSAKQILLLGRHHFLGKKFFLYFNLNMTTKTCNNYTFYLLFPLVHQTNLMPLQLMMLMASNWLSGTSYLDQLLREVI